MNGRHSHNYNNHNPIPLRDYGPEPLVANLDKATEQNTNFRTAFWTGKHLQLTLMNIKPGEDIGVEMHPDVDQFLKIEKGHALVMMGHRRDMLHFQTRVSGGFAVFVPAGTWHNVVNVGNEPLKIYSIYAPPEHPRGTVHRTKADAEAGHR